MSQQIIIFRDQTLDASQDVQILFEKARDSRSLKFILDQTAEVLATEISSLPEDKMKNSKIFGI